MIFLVISLNLLGAYSCSGSWYILIYYWVIPLEQCSCAFSESNDECLYCKCRMRYFKDSNFLPRRKFGITCFENSYARDFVKYAAEQFGRDHQEIAKWLSGSDLKKVALFGCPSIANKTVFSAKRLRAYFRIQEVDYAANVP
ncbi:uncharacterized protein [Solanum lycopersicum]|uniref:uncharacterized protein isoform X2 n=1 Tax=Solanum lycopersicum TaxID=4081 RepID=UPI000532AD6A|nr:uncharacterized protein LOC101247991 isoform X2 [Solanum lycopersicum]